VGFSVKESMSTQDEKATPSPNPFALVDEECDGVRVLAVSGELDLDTAPQLEERLEAGAPGAGLLIDLSGCEFIDSTGIGLIVRTWQHLDGDPAADGKGRFALCGLGDQVRRLIEITGLEAAIQTYGERDEALTELRGD
jgi:anti-anti-sigma factor